MGKLLQFPSRKPILPSRAEMVEEVATILMKEVATVFIEQRFEQTGQAVWFREIRDYLWREEIKLADNLGFRDSDMRRWRMYWRNQALNYIEGKTIR